MATRFPAEFEPHARTWLAWPHMADEWGHAFEGARTAVAAMCRALAESGEPVSLLVHPDCDRVTVRQRVQWSAVALVPMTFGDIWLRDTGPLFVIRDGAVAATGFEFNGWGGKYLFDGDADVAATLCEHRGIDYIPAPLVCEGGAIETDGRGTALVTRQCLLAHNRNPSATEASVEAVLSKALGIERVVWIERGLKSDHTDGHIDNLARFVPSGAVACAEPGDRADPNRDVHASVARDLCDAGFDIVHLPSPGAVTSPTGELLAASHLNFYIANDVVLMPAFGTGTDDRARDVLAGVFSDRRVVALDARDVLCGGGALHCISQPEPRVNTA